MHHLQAEKPLPDRTVQAHGAAGGKLLDLGWIKMQEPDNQIARAVADDGLKLLARWPANSLAAKNLSLALLAFAGD